MQVSVPLHGGIFHKRPDSPSVDSVVLEPRVFEPIEGSVRVHNAASSSSALRQTNGLPEPDFQTGVFKNKNIDELPVISQKAIRAYENVAFSKPPSVIEVVGVDIFV